MDSVSPRTNRLKGASMKESNGQYGLLVVIKADDKSSYKNLVDMFDEINITNVANYALVPLTALDKQALEGLK
jgi:biopolymer transport protein ExbD